MTAIRPYLTALAAAVSGLAGGPVLAHDAVYLGAHSHPHLGGEHLLLSLAAVLVGAWALRMRNGR